jgi:predicted kinase
MSKHRPTLQMLCGKVAAGKSTLAAELAKAPHTILISEDFWTSRLYRDEMLTVDDYTKYSGRLRSAMGPLVEAILRTGVSVVLDFQANTITTRTWMRGILQNTDADHVLHFLDVPDDICKARLHNRNAAGTHDFAVSDA